MTGGDGAPGWTLEAVGFAIDSLDAAEAANTMQQRGERYQTMSWLDNQVRLACATMFTIFFAGQRFAPDLLIEGEPAQEFLQRHYIAAYQQVARRLVGVENVLGFGVMNEPSSGYVGLDDLCDLMTLKCEGPAFTGLASMAVGSGVPMEVTVYKNEGLRRVPSGTALLNPEGISAWRDSDLDIWKRAGVWKEGTDGRPVLLRPQHFAGVCFLDTVLPFAMRFIAAMRAHLPEVNAFLEGSPGSAEVLRWPAADRRVVNANHWYDIGTLLTNTFDPEFGVSWFDAGRITTGASEVRESYRDQIRNHVRASVQHLGGCPTFLGEFGVPFGLNQPGGRLGSDYAAQVAALSAYFDAVDDNLVHGTVWNYSPDNNHRFGDRWNGEDLSLFSIDDRADGGGLDSGGRAVRGFCRPYVQACAGTLLSQRFDSVSRVFDATVEAHPASAPTSVFVPRIHYPNGAVVESSGGIVQSPFAPADASQHLSWHHPETGRYSLRLSPA